MQTSYSINLTDGAAGVQAYTNQGEVYSKVNPNDVVPFGQGVYQDAASAESVKRPVTGGQFVGVAVRDTAKEGSNFEANSSLGVLAKGQIWVAVEGPVTLADDVFVRVEGKKQIQTLTFAADLIAANQIDFTVNGTAISVTFAVSNAATLADITAAIALVAGVSSATDNGVHVITVTSDQDVDLEITTPIVTLGVSQTTCVVAQTQAGIPLLSRGKFRADADGGTAEQVTRARWISEAGSNDDVAILDVNLP